MNGVYLGWVISWIAELQVPGKVKKYEIMSKIPIHNNNPRTFQARGRFVSIYFKSYLYLASGWNLA